MQDTLDEDYFRSNFNYNSFIPLLVFILGVYIMLLILERSYSEAFFVMLLTFVLYIVNNIIVNIKQNSTVFNEFLEDMSAFLTFGVNLIIFGIIFYKGSISMLLVLFFFALTSILSMARSWVLKMKNSMGFPIAFNGLFFPLIFYVFRFYLQDPGSSIFLIYYFLIGILAVSKINFITFEETIEEELNKKHLEESFFGTENIERLKEEIKPRKSWIENDKSKTQENEENYKDLTNSMASLNNEKQLKREDI